MCGFLMRYESCIVFHAVVGKVLYGVTDTCYNSMYVYLIMIIHKSTYVLCLLFVMLRTQYIIHTIYHIREQHNYKKNSTGNYV